MATKKLSFPLPEKRPKDSMLHRAIFFLMKEAKMTPADLIRTGVRSKNTTYRVCNFESDMSMIGAAAILEHFGCRLIDAKGRDITSYPEKTKGDRAESRPRRKRGARKA